LLMRI